MEAGTATAKNVSYFNFIYNNTHVSIGRCTIKCEITSLTSSLLLKKPRLQKVHLEIKSEKKTPGNIKFEIRKVEIGSTLINVRYTRIKKILTEFDTGEIIARVIKYASPS